MKERKIERVKEWKRKKGRTVQQYNRKQKWLLMQKKENENEKRKKELLYENMQ